MSESIIQFAGVAKSYPIYNLPSARLKELLTFNQRSYHEDFWALRDISFSIERGETFCIVGENGSGKSTLLQIVAGILHPSSGDVQVRGRVAALLELGSGFNPEFTGRDNVYLNAAILGLSHREIDSKFERIADFAEIGEFMDHPVKTYSSGMAIRLAFSVAIHVDPDVLLVDEALSVGDIYFRQRCLRKIHEMRQNGVTIVFVSHAAGEVKAIGDRVLWLEHGSIRMLGEPEAVITQYLAAMIEKDSAYLTARHTEVGKVTQAQVLAPEVVDSLPNIDHRFGDERAKVLGIAVLDSSGQPISLIQPDSSLIVRISVQAHQDILLPIVGFMMRNHMGLDFAGTNTAREETDLPPMAAGDVYTLDFHLQIPQLYPSVFTFSPAIADGTLHSYRICDWVDNAIALQMSPGNAEVYGHMHLPCRVQVNRRLRQSGPAERKLA